MKRVLCLLAIAACGTPDPDQLGVVSSPIDGGHPYMAIPCGLEGVDICIGGTRWRCERSKQTPNTAVWVDTEGCP